MRKEILFLRGEYCPNLESLKELMRRYSGEEDLRDEILTYYSDEVLQRWLDENGANMVLKISSNLSDIECFKSLYQTIVGAPCSFNLECDFFKYAELARVEIDGKSYPIQSDGSIRIASGKQLSFVFKPKKMGNEKFVFVIKREDNEVTDQHTKKVSFHPESLYQEFSVSFQLKASDIKENQKVELAIRQDGKDSALCTIIFGSSEYIKLPHRFNPQCYLSLYHLKNQPYYMSEVIRKDRKQLRRIFGHEYEINLNKITNGLWDSSEFSPSEVVLMKEDYLGKNYSLQFQYPTDKLIKDFLDSFSGQFDKCIFVRTRSLNSYPSQKMAKAEYVTCFSIHEKYIKR